MPWWAGRDCKYTGGIEGQPLVVTCLVKDNRFVYVEVTKELDDLSVTICDGNKIGKPNINENFLSIFRFA